MENETVVVEEEDINTQEEEPEVVEAEAQETEETTEEVEETDSAEETTEESESEEGEVVVEIEGETPPQEDKPAPQWVKNLRKENKELKKQLKAEKKLEEKTPSIVLGKEPEIDDDGIDYDTQIFKAKWNAWNAKKQTVEKQEAETKTQQEQANQEWNTTLEGYSEKKTALNAKDFEEVEDSIKEQLSETQQGIILQGAENSAVVMYAIGKNPERLADLSKIQDPIKFAFAVAKLEPKLTVTTRKAATKPEKTIKGAGSISSAGGSKLERLRAEADKSGDMTHVLAHKRQLKKQAKK